MPIFGSDHDFLKAFENKEKLKKDTEESHLKSDPEITKKNKHGVSILDDLSKGKRKEQNSVKENFIELLEESFKNKKSAPVKPSSPMPLKKRIKRYPPVELELDLHGYNATGAQVKTRSFIHSCKQQGYFTVRIIVGKGLHSDCGPVLPDVVEDILKEMKKQDLVIFYKWDKKKKSKSGAVIVYLKHFEQFD